MNYRESIEWIHEQAKFGINPGVERMEWMLEALGHPENDINGIHVAGTNGKGSTVSYLRAALRANGYEVGTFTSPYIETFNERISLNGSPITDTELAELANAVRPVSQRMQQETDYGTATEFEIITTMMFLYLGRMHPVDFAVIEAGLGATYDSTNVFSPIMTIMTSIGLDHIEILGDTLTDIAKDKAGVIKPGIPLIFNVKDDASKNHIYKVLEDKGSPGIELDREIMLRHNNGEFSYQYKHYDFEDLKLSMLGDHQKENAALAITALLELEERELLKLEINDSILAIEENTWSGRIEIINEQPLIILDGAHNEEATDALIQTMETNYSKRDITVLFSATKGKPVDNMASKLSLIAGEFIVTEFDFFKKLPAGDIYQNVPHINKRIIEDYIEFIRTFDGDVLLVTGSLYFISEVKQYFK